MKIKIRRLRVMIESEEKKRQAQKDRHREDVEAGRCCYAHHYGCKEKRKHSHLLEGDILITESGGG